MMVSTDCSSSYYFDSQIFQGVLDMERQLSKIYRSGVDLEKDRGAKWITGMNTKAG